MAVVDPYCHTTTDNVESGKAAYKIAFHQRSPLGENVTDSCSGEVHEKRARYQGLHQPCLTWRQLALVVLELAPLAVVVWHAVAPEYVVLHQAEGPVQAGAVLTLLQPGQNTSQTH